MTREQQLRELAVRLWTAAESIDAIRGGMQAWWWAGKQVARLSQKGQLESPDAIRPIVEALEARLQMERKRREGVER